MAKNLRDDFPERTKDKLWRRVSGRCSKPECRVQTQGPATDEEGTVNVGKAAHITAAAPGGPRYNALLKPEQRKGFKNGIWLCAIHADLIDRDVAGHPVQLLEEWKVRAESSARRELGVPLPSPEDAVKLLSVALGGTGTLAPSAIGNVHRAVSQTLESLDPRFRVSTSYRDGITEHEITPVQPVDLCMEIDAEQRPEFSVRMQDLLTKGQGFEIDSAAIQIVGSPLFERVSAETSPGTLGFFPVPKAVRIEVWLQHVNHAEKLHAEFFDGELVAGTEAMSVYVRCWGGLAQMTFEMLRPGSDAAGNFELTYSVERWHGLDIRCLPYFDRFRAVMQVIFAGARLYANVEIDGQTLATITSDEIAQPEKWKVLEAWLTYTAAARTITRATGQSVTCNLDANISPSSFQNVLKVESYANGTFVRTRDQFKTNPTFSAEIKAEGMAEHEITALNYLRIQELSTSPIEIFGQDIALPNHTITMQPVRLKVLDRSAGANANGTIAFEVEMPEDFLLTISLQDAGAVHLLDTSGPE